ncbi:MAG: isoprenylcysteine carboxylmethyltransferase family protein [Candidatus Korobacteraceae bacterium]
MTLHALLDFAGLAIGSVYATIPLFWLTVHPMINRWRAAGRRAYLAVVPLWFAYALVAFAIAWRFRHVHLYVSWMAWVPAVLFLLMGAALYQAGRQRFEKAKIIGLAELEPSKHAQELITSGIRSRVRHPIYLGHFCELFGWMLGTGSLAVAGLLAFYLFSGLIMMRREDAELEERFGEAFRQYRAGVPGFLPR